MRPVLSFVIACAIWLASGLPALAHHSGAAEFDSNKKIDLTGVVTKVEWTNPHAHFYMDVKDSERQGGELEPGTRQPERFDPERLEEELFKACRNGHRDRDSSQG